MGAVSLSHWLNENRGPETQTTVAKPISGLAAFSSNRSSPLGWKSQELISIVPIHIDANLRCF